MRSVCGTSDVPAEGPGTGIVRAMSEPTTVPDTDQPEKARIGLLKCGTIRTDLVPVHGDYPELFGAFMAAHPVEIVTFDAEHGRVPDDPGECDGWIVSGSADSVYDGLPWMEETSRFLRTIVDAAVPLVGVCFGHQLLAQALGGEVTRSERGWGVGVHHYDVIEPLPSWPEGSAQPTSLSLIASHQDQVTRVPEMATVLASSHHCPVAAYSVGERVLAVQAHPEFTPDLSRDLVSARRDVIGPERADAAILSLDQSIDNDLVANWFAAILAP